MKKLIIFGIGKIADVVFTYIKADTEREIAAFTVDGAYVREDSWHGRPVVPFEEVEMRFSPATHDLFVAVGYQDLNRFRAAKCQAALDKGYTLARYCHSRASNPGSATIGPNTLVLENAVIQPGARVGWNTFIWSGNHIGHHATVGDHCYFSGQCIVGGSTVIESYCYIGVNATVGHELTIGEGSFIGAGARITKNVAAGGVYIEPDTSRFRLDAEHFMRLTKMK